MLRVTVICVGKLKEKFYAQAAAEYVKRLGRYCKLDLIELPEQRLPDAPAPAEIERALFREAGVIRGKIPPASCVAALCIEGQLRSSEELAQLLALHGGNVRACAYDILIRKAENTSITLPSGITLPDQAAHYLRRAAQLRPIRTRNAQRADDAPPRPPKPPRDGDTL